MIFAPFLSVIFLFIFSPFVSAFEEVGEYKFDSEAWIEKKHPEGKMFLCKPCTTEIRVQITYGPRSKDITVTKFEGLFKNEQKRKVFAKEIIEKQLPLKKGVKIEVNNISYGELFRLRVLAFTAVVEMGPMVLRDTTYIGIHRNRIVKITLNYLDGDLDETARKALNEFMGTLVFYP